MSFAGKLIKNVRRQVSQSVSTAQASFSVSDREIEALRALLESGAAARYQENSLELALWDRSIGEYLIIPVIPEKIKYTDGSTQYHNVTIVNLGEIAVPNGVALDGAAWESFFPARYDPGYCVTEALKTPVEYRNLFSTWKDQGTKLQLICPQYSINKPVTIESFSWSVEGFEGDIYYQVSFKEVKKIVPKKVTPGGELVQTGKKVAEEREPLPSRDKPLTWEVKPSDTIVSIAKRFGITDWHKIYNANKTVIGTQITQLPVGQVLKL